MRGAACSGGTPPLPWRFISTVSSPGPARAANSLVITREPDHDSPVRYAATKAQRGALSGDFGVTP